MELWELVARESIRDRIARWNSNGDAGRMADMVMVLAPDVEFQAAESEVLHGRDAVLAFLTGVKQDKADSAQPAPPVRTGRYLPPGKRPSIRHFTSNPQIEFESETRRAGAHLLPGACRRSVSTTGAATSTSSAWSTASG